MGKKDKRFSKSQAWLDWLSDEKAANHTPAPQKPAREPLGVSRSAQTLPPRPYTQRPSVRPPLTPQTRSLGLDSSAFRVSSRVPQQVAPKAKFSRRTKRKQYPAAPTQDDTITVNLHLPSIKLPKIEINWRKTMLYGGVGMLIVGLIFGTPLIVKTINGNDAAGSSKTDATSDKPAFATILPAKDTDGYVQTSQTYDATKQIYYFKGKYNDIDIVGTEQALPEVFKTTESMLKDQAARIGATEAIDVVGGAAYVSPSDGNTSQRAVYASSQILVFVTYSGVMKNSEWVKFLQSLE